jgi:hypothetical protein
MIKIHDHLNTLTPDQQKQLVDKSLAYPFDIQVTIGSNGMSKQAFQTEVSSLAKTNSISIGIDPAHKFTFVRGSRDLGLPSGPELAAAGNAYFRKADLVGGIDSIAARAKDMKAVRVTESATGAPIVVREEPMATGWWWALGVPWVAVVCILVWVWVRKIRRERALEEEAERLRSIRAELNNELGDAKIRNAETGGVALVPIDDFDRRLAEAGRLEAERARRRPTYSSQAPEPVYQAPVVVQQTNNDLLTGVLLGSMMNDHHSHTTITHRSEPAPSASDSGSSSSWGSSSDSSSSSSWSDSSSSSSSSDWGSSSDSGSSSGSDW